MQPLAVDLNITGLFDLGLQVIQAKLGQHRSLAAQLQKGFATNQNTRPDDKAGVTVLAHAKALDRTAAVAGDLAEYPQQAVSLKAGTGAEAAVWLPVHAPAHILANNIGRIGNADHNAFEIDLLQVRNNLIGHFDGIVEHIQAGLGRDGGCGQKP